MPDVWAQFQEEPPKQSHRKAPWGWMGTVSVVIVLGVIGLLLWKGASDAKPTAPQIESVSITDQVETKDFGLGWSASYNLLGLPILIKTPDPSRIELEISTDVGCFYTRSNTKEISMSYSDRVDLGQKFTIESDHAIYWTYLYVTEDGTYTNDSRIDHFFTKIILREEECIVGYAVLMIAWNFYHDQAYLLYPQEYLYYPKVNGEYQAITEEYVNSEMDKIIAEAERDYQEKNATKLQYEYPEVEIAHEADRIDISAENSPGVPVLVTFPDWDGLSLEYIAGSGNFFYDPDDPQGPPAQLEPLGRRFTLPEGHTVYWQPDPPAADEVVPPEGKVERHEFAVILRDGEHIVCAAVISMGLTVKDSSVIAAQQLYDRVSYPKVDGAYQPVTEAYLQGWFDAHEYDWVDLTGTKR